jgi:archaellum component FlaF (FlaF/FlaG flagellin family)
MAKIRLINTTKINGSFVEGGTVLEIGIDLTKEEAKNLKNQKIAEDFLSIEEIEEVWEHYNAKDAIDRALYYTGSYTNQLVKFDVLHNGNLINKFYNLNQTSEKMYCYYSYLQHYQKPTLSRLGL